ncbi:MAG: FAD-binding oxidoreductase [Alphaproteobacteria bacterium]|nr:FAD-binding oxidoreductase [Alphaproteobacteria bacterium]
MEGKTATLPYRPQITTLGACIDRLSTRLRSGVLLPQSDGYETARRVWNGLVDKRPAAILMCARREDVVEAVNAARTCGLTLAVRGGGHSVAGASVCDGGLVIDLSRMKAVLVDPEQCTVRAEPGLRLGEFDAATQAHGLAVTMGVNSDTGIAGLTLGGGFGRLGRKLGLAYDNLLSAEMVLADGRCVTASATTNPDLFWAIRGGGGNFGIVTSFTYRLHLLGPQILGGLLVHDFDRAREVLRFYRSFSRTAPDDISTDAVFLTAPDGRRLVALSVCYIGPVDEGERALRPLREFGQPLQDLIAPVAYTALQASADPLFAPGRRYYWKAQFLKDLSDSAIDALVDGYACATSPLSLAVLQQVGGAIARVPADATAYGNRDAAYDCFPAAIWEDPAEDERHIAWARKFWEAMRPFATGGVYANNLGEEGEERVRAAYGGNYARLAAVKAIYDPDNLFRLNQNIRPAR